MEIVRGRLRRGGHVVTLPAIDGTPVIDINPVLNIDGDDRAR